MDANTWKCPICARDVSARLEVCPKCANTKDGTPATPLQRLASNPTPMQSEAHQLSRLVWLVGLGWLLVVGLTAWLWGRTGEQIGGAAWVASVVTGVLGVAFGALLARRRQIALAFAMALLGAFAATVVFTIALFSGPDLGLDSYYPGWEFVLFVVVLGVPLAVGAAIAGLWRLSVRVRGV